MGNIISEILSFFMTQPGVLLTRALVIISLLIPLIMALTKLNNGQAEIARRMVLGLVIIMLFQAGLLVLHIMELQQNALAAQLLPIAERGAAVFCLMWCAWLWLFPESERGSGAIIIITSILVLIALALCLYLWLQMGAATSIQSNILIFNNIWHYTGMGIGVLGIIGLLIKRPRVFLAGVVVLLVFTIGHLFEFFIVYNGAQMPAMLRLTQLIAYPLQIMWMMRLISTRLVVSPTVPPSTQKLAIEQRSNEKRLDLIMPKLAYMLATLSMQAEHEDQLKAIARTAAMLMMSDLCFIVRLPDEIGIVTFECGYDLVREEYLRRQNLQHGQIPLIIKTIEDGMPMQLPSSLSGTPDVITMQDLIGANSPGNLMIIPLITNDNETAGGLLFMTPYTNRKWEEAALKTVFEVSPIFAELILGQPATSPEKPAEANGFNFDFELLQRENEILKEQTEKAQQENETLKQQLDAIKSLPVAAPLADDQDLDQPPAIDTSEMEKLNLALDEKINQLMTENENLKQALAAKEKTENMQASEITERTNKQILDLGMQIQQVNQQLELANRDNENLRRTIVTMEQEKLLAQPISDEMEQLKLQISTLKSNETAYIEKIQELQEKAEEKQNNWDNEFVPDPNIARLHEEVTALTGQLEQLREHEQTLNSKLLLMLRENEQLKHKIFEIEAFTPEFDPDIKKELEDTQAQLINIKDREQMMMRKLQLLMKENDELKKALSYATAQVQHLEISKTQPLTITQAQDSMYADAASNELLSSPEVIYQVGSGKVMTRVGDVVDLAELTNDIKSSLKDQFDNRNVNLLITKLNKPIYIQKPCEPMPTIITNMLYNALMATPKGDFVQLAMDVEEGDQNNHFLSVIISDRGEGLSADDQANLLNSIDTSMPFKPKGVGDLTALVIALRQLQSIKGKISISSNIGKSSTFKALIPIQSFKK